MAPEVGPNSFGSFEKRAAGLESTERFTCRNLKRVSGLRKFLNSGNYNCCSMFHRTKSLNFSDYRVFPILKCCMCKSTQKSEELMHENALKAYCIAARKWEEFVSAI